MYLSGERSSQLRTPTQHQVWHFEDISMDYLLAMRPCWRPTNLPWFETEQVHIHLRTFTYPFFTQYTSNSCNFTPPLEHRLLSISQPTFPSLVLYSNSFKIKYWAWFTAFFCVRKLPLGTVFSTPMPPIVLELDTMRTRQAGRMLLRYATPPGR